MSSSVKVIDSTKKILDAPEGSTLAFLCGSYGWQQHDTFRMLNAIDPYLVVQFNTFAISWEPDYGNYEYIKAQGNVKYSVLFIYIDTTYSRYRSICSKAMESITNGFNEIINSETLYISELWLFKSSIDEYNIFWENIKIAIESCTSGFGNIVINAANN